MELHIILLWNVLEVIWKTPQSALSRLQVEKGRLLTSLSKYKRRIILPFLDQVHEEREVLLQSQIAAP